MTREPTLVGSSSVGRVERDNRQSPSCLGGLNCDSERPPKLKGPGFQVRQGTQTPLVFLAMGGIAVGTGLGFG
jgi:hypothetical protein